jgi:DNA-binding SARP family transcriptional activator
VPREELAELIWPANVGRTAHRLAVALSIVRSTLDPDRRHPTDRYVIGDTAGVALDLTSIRIDALEFVDAVSYGSRLYEQYDPQARPALLAAVATYRGEAFADDPYPEWTGPLREQVRVAYLRALRALARLARRARDTDEALQRLLTLLEHDPFDESAHRDVVAVLTAAGRIGEARRAQARYADAMRTIGIQI